MFFTLNQLCQLRADLASLPSMVGKNYTNSFIAQMLKLWHFFYDAEM